MIPTLTFFSIVVALITTFGRYVALELEHFRSGSKIQYRSQPTIFKFQDPSRQLTLKQLSTSPSAIQQLDV